MRPPDDDSRRNRYFGTPLQIFRCFRQSHVLERVDRFQEAVRELALVCEGEEIVGLVTTTDAVEEVMGGLRDPMDEAYDSPQVEPDKEQL